jgi:UDP-N-acetyl-2-amino-2-deoxyglucuronate dehydrogenase
MSINEIGFGIVSGGMIGKVHAEAINAIPGAKLVAVWSRDETRGHDLAAKYQATSYTDYAQFLAHPGLNIVNVCSPSGLHLDHGQAAAEAGKHVLVEKPIEINLERADALIAACEKAGVKLGVIFQSRFLPMVQQMKAAIEAGKLGRLILGDAYVKWYRAPEYYADSWHGTMALDGGGALINQAIHTIDLLRWMMGPVESAMAMKKALRYPNIEAEDTLVGNLQFANGALGAVVATTSVKPGFKRRVEISGERGTIILDGDAISVWDIEGESSAPGAAAQITDGSSNPAAISTEGHRLQIEDMLHAVRENQEPIINGHEGRKSLEVVTALYQAATERRFVTL